MKRLSILVGTVALFGLLVGCNDQANTKDIKEFSYVNQWGEDMHCITINANTHYAMMGCVIAHTPAIQK
jgi:hypothetical protein